MKVGLLVCSICLLGICPLTFPPAACVAQEEIIAFPYVLKIAPGNVLFVHGCEFRDRVVFTWEEGDSLRIEGMPVLPARPVPPKVFSEERLAELFGKVPFVVQRVKDGATWKEATNEYDRKRDQIKADMIDRYWAVLDSTGSARLAQESVMDSTDRSLFVPGTTPALSTTGIMISWEGLIRERFPLERRRVVDREPNEAGTTEAEAVRYIRRVAQYLDGSRGVPWVVVIDRRAKKLLYGGDAREALEQIENARLGGDTCGPLDEFGINEIIRESIRHEGGE